MKENAYIIIASIAKNYYIIITSATDKLAIGVL